MASSAHCQHNEAGARRSAAGRLCQSINMRNGIIGKRPGSPRRSPGNAEDAVTSIDDAADRRGAKEAPVKPRDRGG